MGDQKRTRCGRQAQVVLSVYRSGFGDSLFEAEAMGGRCGNRRHRQPGARECSTRVIRADVPNPTGLRRRAAAFRRERYARAKEHVVLVALMLWLGQGGPGHRIVTLSEPKVWLKSPPCRRGKPCLRATGPSTELSVPAWTSRRCSRNTQRRRFRWWDLAAAKLANRSTTQAALIFISRMVTLF